MESSGRPHHKNSVLPLSENSIKKSSKKQPAEVEGKMGARKVNMEKHFSVDSAVYSGSSSDESPESSITSSSDRSVTSVLNQSISSDSRRTDLTSGYDSSSVEDLSFSDDGSDIDDNLVTFEEALDQSDQEFQILKRWGDVPDTSNADDKELATGIAEIGFDEAGNEVEEGDLLNAENGELSVNLWEDSETGTKWVERSRSVDKSSQYLSQIMATDGSEFEILQKLSHPNIVTMIGAEIREYEREIEIVLAMEYAGKPLSKALLDVPEEQRVSSLAEWGVVLMGVLDYLKDENLMHRDIKPSNLLINPDNGLLKLIDFGEARDCSQSFPDDERGTETYAAPETLNSQPQSYASEIYSSGRSFVEVLMGAGVVNSSWIREYKKGEDITLQLSLGWKNNAQALSMVKTVEHMLKHNPEERLPAEGVKSQLQALIRIS